MSDLPPTPRGLPPVTVIALAVASGLAVVFLMVFFAHQPAWLGLNLKPAENGLLVVRSQGPAAAIPPGTVLRSVSSSRGASDLIPLDRVIEPDGLMGDYGTYARFLERQRRLAAIQQAETVTFTDAAGNHWPVGPLRPGRPLSSLPPDFWAQVIVALVAWLVSTGVYAFRPRDRAARYLLLSGLSTLTFSAAAAPYTTRELAIDGSVFHWLSDLNFLGGSLFAASFVALLLYYPKPIAPRWLGVAVVLSYIVWFILQQVGLFEDMTFARRFLVMVGVFTTFVLAAVHWFRTRKDPLARAALQWFLLSWMVGTCAFCCFILLPQMFGIDTSALQGYSFLLFLLVYGGLAFGILRYRLFELGIWWRRAVLWTCAVLVMVLLDLLFLFGLGLSSGISMSLALLICGVVWLPLRAWLWGRFSRSQKQRQGEWFRHTLDIALAGPAEQDARWRHLMNAIFDPLHVAGAPDPGRAVIDDHGQALVVPAMGGIGPLRLEFAAAGRRLFNPQDVATVTELAALLRHAMESRSAYEQGVAEERGRIARDIHDNIGARLLAALHSIDPEKKNAKIRETLGDLRDIINNSPAEDVAMDMLLAELRAECSDRLTAAGIGMRWSATVPAAFEAPAAMPASIRALVREAVSNAIRHSAARQVGISLRGADGGIELEIDDDGAGFDPQAESSGSGLANMRERASRLGGSLGIHRDRGTRLRFRFPSHPATPPP